MGLLYLFILSAGLGALASSQTRKRLRPKSRTVRRLAKLATDQRPDPGTRPAMNGLVPLGGNAALSTRSGCECAR